jgi:hypothetical protein
MQRLGKNKLLLNFIIGKAEKSEKLRELLTHSLTQEKPLDKIITPWGLLKILLM